MTADEATSPVRALLNREIELDALEALVFALRRDDLNVPLAETAIAFDTNVFLRMGVHPRSSDIIDYLRTSHVGPLILPGQVIQEFWNNQFLAVQSLAESIRRKYENLCVDVAKIDENFGAFSERFSLLLREFSADFGYIYDEATLRRVHALLDAMKEKAIVPYAPRELFSQTAVLRKRTKTPPGFKDDGDGDFFVWADLLVGLQGALNRGSSFKRVVLLSQDQKIDWTRDGTPHPILSAEMRALTGASFEIWQLDRLAKELD